MSGHVHDSVLKPYHPDFVSELLRVAGLWDRFCWSTFLYIAVHSFVCDARALARAMLKKCSRALWLPWV